MKTVNIIYIFFAMLLAQSCFAQYVPAKVEVSTEQVNVNGTLFYLHKVEAKQTLYSIAKAYKTDVESISKENPALSSGLKEGSIIYIRVKGYNSFDVSQKADSLKKEVVAEENLNEREGRELFDLFNRGKYDKITVSLLLPLGGPSDLSDSTKNRDLRQPNNFMEFYQGFLLALEDIKKANPGIKLTIKVVDTDDYKSSRDIVKSGVLDNSSIIIGPVFNENIEPVIKYAKQQGIYVVSPMDPASEHFANEYSNFYQVSTPVSYQQRGILSAVNIFSHVTLIFEDTGTSPIELVTVTQDILESNRVRYNAISYSILKGRSILPSIEQQLKQDQVNHVIVASNSEAFVSDVLRNLNLLKSQKGYNIVIYGTPRWRSFETVDINYYHGMNLNISMQYYVDYSRDNIKEFLSKFRAIYNSEPSPYAFQAYDIAGYFIGNMWKHGRDFINNSEDYKMEMLHSDYNFKRVVRDGGYGEYGGYINTAIRRVIYKPDYSTTDIRGFFR